MNDLMNQLILFFCSVCFTSFGAVYVVSQVRRLFRG